MSLSCKSTSLAVSCVRDAARIGKLLAPLERHYISKRPIALSHHPAWTLVLADSMGHTPLLLTADYGSTLVGQLPLVLLNTRLFGRFLVSLSYSNYGGPLADTPEIAHALVEHAIVLADESNVKFLELRQITALDHPKLERHAASKIHMILPLPQDTDQLWNSLEPKVRNQVRKAQKNNLTVEWGEANLVEPFYDVFCKNMRDLGTPVFPSSLFREAIRRFPNQAEICVVRSQGKPIAGAFLTHGWGVTEVPSASSLREYNSTCANMLMYWNLLERAIQRGHTSFDFGRSTPDGPVYRFKKQWGASPTPAEWQVYRRSGSGAEMRPDNPRYSRAIDLWKKLPLPVTRWLGPLIVRGIP